MTIIQKVTVLGSGVMGSQIVALCLGVLMMFAIPAHAEVSAPFAFEGEVKRGENYTHLLPEGLYFHLVPISMDNSPRVSGENNLGWRAVISAEPDFAHHPAAPNFELLYPRKEGWTGGWMMGFHFQKSPSGSMIDPLPAHRQIEFVLTADDLRYFHCQRQDFFAQSVTPADCNKPQQSPQRMGHAAIDIVDYQLDKPKADKKLSGFTAMRFKVTGDYRAAAKNEK